MILAAYGFVPRSIRLLQTYWGRLTIVARAGGYFGRPFKGYHSVTQGKPLYPTIFNVVMDAIIRHWGAMVAPTEDDTEGLGILIQDLATYFYATNGLITSTQL